MKIVKHLLFYLLCTLTFNAYAKIVGWYSTHQTALAVCNSSYYLNCKDIVYVGYPLRCVNERFRVAYYIKIIGSEAIGYGHYSCPYGYLDNSCLYTDSTSGLCSSTPADQKTFGQPKQCKDQPSFIGNPCNASNGNKYQQETDYNSANTKLSFIRHYNSGSSLVDNGFGYGWTHQMVPSLEVSTALIVVHQADGRGESFTLNNSTWQGDTDTHLVLTEDSTGFTLVSDQGITERYDLNGRVLSQTSVVGLQTTYSYNSNNQVDLVTGPFGHTLGFSYDANNRIATMTDPDTKVYQYEYDSVGNLDKVIYPDTKFKRYHYEDSSWPNALTGITDENGDRFATFAYAADGKAIVTEHAITSNTTPQEHFGLNYDSDTQTTVTDPIGTAEVLTYAKNMGVKNLVSRINQTDSKGFTRIYDAQNNLTSHTDAEGRVTLYGYNASNQQTSITEASGTAQERVTLIDYLSPDLDLPILITKPSVAAGQTFQTDIQYNPDHTVKDITLNGFKPDGTGISRITAFQYNTVGQVTEINGPLTAVSDITIVTYYECTTGTECGQLASVTNALGHSTSYDLYDNNGRVKQTTSPLGVITVYSYDLRGRLKQIVQTPPAGQGSARTTGYTYDDAGQLETLTTPDNIILTYGYDAAHDLRSITDNLGNLLEYRYDLKGNRIESNSRTSTGTLKQTLKKEYDYLNNLKLVIGGEGQITRFDYDYTGKQTVQMDPRSTGSDLIAAKALNPALTDNTISSLYDSLDRLTKRIHLQTAEDANNPGTQDSSDDIVTDYHYNALDQLVTVTDPNGLDTTYQYNDFDDLLELSSPDTGITSYDYDEAGNRLSQTDAKNIFISYAYDVLNRLKTISYPDSSLNVVYSYDENSNGENGIGQLTSMQDASGLTQYQYDVFANLAGKSVQSGTVNQSINYAYNGNDQLTQLTYPSGRKVNYLYDAAGRIDSVTTTDTQGNTQPLLANLDYQPFGPLNSQDFGNSLTTSITHDLDYRLTDLTTPSILERGYGLDEASNIESISDQLNASQDQTLNYDGLSRLDTAQGNYGSVTYQYDPTSNRIQRTQGSTTDNYNYSVDSHRLRDINNTANYQYDANGNTTQLPHPSILTSLTYGDHNRLTQINGYSYTYNGQGERVIKDNNAGVMVYYFYDQNGKLLVETDGNGNTQKEYVYTNGQLVALIESTSGSSSSTEIILDNQAASYSDSWSTSTSILGFQGSNYQHHTGNIFSTGPGLLGSPIDNAQVSFTDNWPTSTSVDQYYGNNYQYHAGSAAGLGVLGTPVDNLQATYTGTWTTSTSVNQYYAGNYQFHAAGTGSNTATWAAGVNSSASYDVYVSWTAHANRASNAKFTVNHTGGSNTATVNQQQNGNQWNLLGTFTLDANSTVSLSDDANGYVIADAISILPAGTPPTVTPQSGETASWALNVSNTASYDVYANWTAHANRASDAKYTVHHSNGSDTVMVNQKQNGGQWNLLGTYTLDNTSSVDLSSLANGYVTADGITVLPAGTPPTVTPSQAETATWAPNQSGEYEIYANWTAYANRATDAKYTIQHSSGNDTLSVNQQQNGGQWNLLGTFTLDPSSTIELSNDANGYVIADGIRLVSTSSTSQSSIYYVHNDHLGTPQVITDAQQAVVWQAYYDPFGKATITTETITNNIRFPGQYYDSETGLYYNYYRYYDPQTGRYITSDPIGLQGGLNTYGYVSGNPVNLIDPLGLSSLVFDRSDKAVTLLDSGGNKIASAPAGNNVTSLSNGQWPNGTFDYIYYKPHPESGVDDSYGSYGNFVFDVPMRTGMGLHSGRKNKQGTESKTLGCVRTTDEFTNIVKQNHFGDWDVRRDPLTTITVQE